MKQASDSLQTALVLRVIAIMAFPVGVVLAALFERSLLIVAGLAIGMLFVSWVERIRLLNLAGNDEPIALAGLLPGFAWRLGFLLGVFILSLGILALFRETALARSFSLTDLALLLGTIAIALTANAVSARIAVSEVGGAMAKFNAAFGGSSANDNSGAGEIIEGEVIDRD